MRPDPLATAVPPSVSTVGKSPTGPRVTSVAGNLSVGSMPGSWPIAGAPLAELPGARRGHGFHWCKSCGIRSAQAGGLGGPPRRGGKSLACGRYF